MTNRRDFLGGVAGLASAVSIPCLSAFADGRQAVEGSVVADGKPLAGVVVTDGLVCTRTGADGRFRLAKRPGARFVSMTVPSGYRALGRHYRSVDSDLFDFRLTPWGPSAAEGTSFAQVADDETYEVGWYADLKKAAKKGNAAFVIHTGDQCQLCSMRMHAKAMTDDAMERPVYFCPGNHDLVGEDRGESTFEQLFGPCWYSFDSGGVHFAVIPMPWGDRKPSYTHDDVADWLRNDLALVPKGRPVVLFSHEMTYPDSPVKCGRFIGSGAHELDIAKACNLVAFVYGHHHHAYFRRRGNVSLIASVNPQMGGITHDPSSVRVVSVSAKGKVSSRSFYQPVPDWTPSRGGAVWEADLGTGVLGATPVHADGRIFVGTLDEDGRGTGAVVALSAARGRELWRAPMANSVKGAIVCCRGRVIAQDVEGHVRAFDAETGAAVWSFDVEESSWQPLNAGLVADEREGVVYAGYGHRLCALDVLTGSPRLSGLKGWADDGEPACTCPAVGSGVIVTPAQWRGIHANDAATGEHLWFQKNNDTFFCGAVPQIDGNVVRVLVHRHLKEFDLRTGTELRSRDVGANVEISTGILAAGGKLVFGSWDGVVALDAKTLEDAWRLPVGESLVVSGPYCHAPSKSVSGTPALLDAAHGVIGAQDGKLRVFGLADGRVVREIGTGAPYFASSLVVKGVVFAADFAGKVRAFRLDGRKG